MYKSQSWLQRFTRWFSRYRPVMQIPTSYRTPLWRKSPGLTGNGAICEIAKPYVCGVFILTNCVKEPRRTGQRGRVVQSVDSVYFRAYQKHLVFFFFFECLRNEKGRGRDKGGCKHIMYDVQTLSQKSSHVEVWELKEMCFAERNRKQNTKTYLRSAKTHVYSNTLFKRVKRGLLCHSVASKK